MLSNIFSLFFGGCLQQEFGNREKVRWVKVGLKGRHIWFKSLQRIQEYTSDENGSVERDRKREKRKMLGCQGLTGRGGVGINDHSSLRWQQSLFLFEQIPFKVPRHKVGSWIFLFICHKYQQNLMVKGCFPNRAASQRPATYCLHKLLPWSRDQ